MKKVIFSALFLAAFSGGLFAKHVADTPIMGKETLAVRVTGEQLQLIEDDCECINTFIPICQDGEIIGYMSAVICDPNPYKLLDDMGC